MQDEIIERLDRAEAEIERLQGEANAITNIIASVLRDTIRNTPEIGENILREAAREVERLEVEATQRQRFRKEGAQRLHQRFAGAVKSILDDD